MKVNKYRLAHFNNARYNKRNSNDHNNTLSNTMRSRATFQISHTASKQSDQPSSVSRVDFIWENPSVKDQASVARGSKRG